MPLESVSKPHDLAESADALPKALNDLARLCRTRVEKTVKPKKLSEYFASLGNTLTGAETPRGKRTPSQKRLDEGRAIRKEAAEKLLRWEVQQFLKDPSHGNPSILKIVIRLAREQKSPGKDLLHQILTVPLEQLVASFNNSKTNITNYRTEILYLSFQKKDSEPQEALRWRFTAATMFFTFLPFEKDNMDDDIKSWLTEGVIEFLEMQNIKKKRSMVATIDKEAENSGLRDLCKRLPKVKEKIESWKTELRDRDEAEEQAKEAAFDADQRKMEEEQKRKKQEAIDRTLSQWEAAVIVTPHLNGLKQILGFPKFRTGMRLESYNQEWDSLDSVIMITIPHNVSTTTINLSEIPTRLAKAELNEEQNRRYTKRKTELFEEAQRTVRDQVVARESLLLEGLTKIAEECDLPEQVEARERTIDIFYYTLTYTQNLEWLSATAEGKQSVKKIEEGVLAAIETVLRRRKEMEAQQQQLKEKEKTAGREQEEAEALADVLVAKMDYLVKKFERASGLDLGMYPSYGSESAASFATITIKPALRPRMEQSLVQCLLSPHEIELETGSTLKETEERASMIDWIGPHEIAHTMLETLSQPEPAEKLKEYKKKGWQPSPPETSEEKMGEEESAILKEAMLDGMGCAMARLWGTSQIPFTSLRKTKEQITEAFQATWKVYAARLLKKKHESPKLILLQLIRGFAEAEIMEEQYEDLPSGNREKMDAEALANMLRSAIRQVQAILPHSGDYRGLMQPKIKESFYKGESIITQWNLLNRQEL